MPEIGKPMENIKGGIKTDFYAPCGTGTTVVSATPATLFDGQCYSESINAHSTSKIEATLPRVSVGKA